jgi:hypothetical protein
MSDTVLVALIAVSGTLISGAISYQAAKRSTDVQLVAIDGELHRLRVTQGEEHRRERQDIYEAFIAAIEQLDIFLQGWGAEPTREAFNQLTREATFASTRILLLGDEDVVDAMRPVMAALDQFGEAFDKTDPAHELEDRLAEAYEPHQQALIEGEAKLIYAMKVDIAASREAEQRARREAEGVQDASVSA